MISLQEEDEQSEEKSKKSKKDRKQKGKKAKEEKKVINETSVIDYDGDEADKDKGGKITEQESNIIFKFIFENARKRKNQTIDINELWNIIKDKKECKDKKITKINQLCAKLEDEGKIFVSETKEITIV